MAHSKHDRSGREFFDQLFSAAGVRAYWYPYAEGPTHPHSVGISKAIKGSRSLFVVLSKEMATREHTRSWVSFETGIAVALNKPVWVFEPVGETVNIPVPGAWAYLQRPPSTQTLRTFPFEEIVKSAGTRYPQANSDVFFHAICAEEDCQERFVAYVLDPGSASCPACRGKGSIRKQKDSEGGVSAQLTELLKPERFRPREVVEVSPPVAIESGALVDYEPIDDRKRFAQESQFRDMLTGASASRKVTTGRSSMETLAAELLGPKERLLVEHLSRVLPDNTVDSGAVVLEIIPKYWKREGKRVLTLEPDGIYRPFLYIHGYSGRADFPDVTRAFIGNVSVHLEGCLQQLTTTPPRSRGPTVPFGQLIKLLKGDGVLSEDLAHHLWLFNACFNVPSKHPQSYVVTRRVDLRTFSVADAALAFVLMRELSIRLFDLMKKRSVVLPYEWPPFDENWLTYAPSVENRVTPLSPLKKDPPKFG